MDTDLCFRSARELASAIRQRELSAREVVQAHLERIERSNPTVNAITTTPRFTATSAQATTLGV